MIDILLGLALALHLIASLGLFIYGLNCYAMLWLFFRNYKKNVNRQSKEEEKFLTEVEYGRTLPVVTVQLPLYNEYNVAARVIEAVAALDYPREKLEVQVLDDSTDETRDLVDRTASSLREKGTDVIVFRRNSRTGYKAGALAEGLKVAKGEFIAIFDSDFVPEPDFLIRLLAHIVDQPEVGLAQGRWTHLNGDHSLLTKAQTMGIDGHFVVEQCARSNNNLFLNFNGTAGVWRRQAIDDAGGWAADTLTEDMDLSYRSQLAGWKIEYVPGVECPAELPETFRAFKSQQFRWAKGSIQTTIKLMPTVFRSDASWFAKFQSIFHFTHYAVHPMMLTVALLSIVAMHKIPHLIPDWAFGILAIPLIPAMIGPSLLYLVSQRALHPKDWGRRMLRLPLLLIIGFGICLSNSKAVWEAVTGKVSGFVRTPKRGESAKGKKNYTLSNTAAPLLELGLAAWCAFSVVVALPLGQVGLVPFMSCYALGFLTMGVAGLRENA